MLIAGQIALKETMATMVRDGRVAHALLVAARPGGGGLALAIHLARLILCERGSEDTPCGQCPSCTKTDKLAHPDLHFIFPVNSTEADAKAGASDAHLETFRELVLANPYSTLEQWYDALELQNKQGFIGEVESRALRQKLALRSFEGRARVFVIWHADKMRTEFANKFLKNLEEPNAGTYFILVSEHAARLLPTIASRTQALSEEPCTPSEIAEYLKAMGTPGEKSLEVAAQANGSVAEALKLLQQEADPWFEPFKILFRVAYQNELIGLNTWVEAFSKHTRDEQRRFCQWSLGMLQRCQQQRAARSYEHTQGPEAEFVRRFSAVIDQHSTPPLAKVIQEAWNHIDRNVAPKLVWFDAGIEIFRIVATAKKQASSEPAGASG